jgi:hypothetical protein
MTLIDIENLSHADIKARRDELAKAAEAAAVPELALRYVKTLKSAKLRDEKLGEQGRTTNSLNDALGVAKQRVADLETAVQQASAELLKRREEYVALESRASADAETATAALADADSKWQRRVDVEIARAAEDMAAIKAFADVERKEIVDAMRVVEQQLASEMARAERMKAQATRNNGAINAAATALNGAIAAQQIDNADQGE